MNCFYGAFSYEPVNLSSLDNLKLYLSNNPKIKHVLIDQPFVFLTGEYIYHHETTKVAVAVTGSPKFKNLPIHISQKSNCLAKKICELYKSYDQALTEHIYGVYRITVVDYKKNKTLLFTDKFAHKPIYYQALERSFLFSSNINTLANHPSIKYKLSNEAIYSYLYFYVIPSPLTIYENIYKLQASQTICYDKRGISKEKYWKPVFNENNDFSKQELYKRTKKSISSSIDDYINKESIGTFLSGGLDSSTITGLLAKNSSEKIKAFSIGFNQKGYNEIEYARIVAKYFNCEHYEYFISPKDISDSYTRIVGSYSEPFGNSSVIPTYYCAKLAKDNGIKCLLGGDGGDELFAGNTRYIKHRIFEYYSQIPSILRNYLIEPVAYKASSNIKIFNKIQNYIDKSKIKLPERLFIFNFLHSIATENIFYSDFKKSIKGFNPISIIEDRYYELNKISTLNRMMYLDWQFTLADNDLRKVYGACSVANIDVAFPFLNDTVVDLSCQIPSYLKIENNKIRSFFKNTMRDLLPHEVITKSKHGFGLPFGLWMKTYDPLKELIHDNLNSLKKREILKNKFIDNAVNLHQTDDSSYYGELVWVLAVLNTWLSTYHKNPIENEVYQLANNVLPIK